MDKQRKTSNIANVVVTDALNNVSLPNDLTVASQFILSAYTSPTSFTGTAVGLLTFDTSGNVITENVANYVVNTGDVWASTSKITNIVTLTQAEYDAIVSPSSDYLYVII